MRKFSIALVTALLMTSPGFAQDRTPSAEGARVYIISPQDGARFTGPFTVVFGLKGMGVAPAGVEKANTGHHHLLIDTAVPSLAEPLPSDEKNRHFGGGQTEAEISLAPGLHSLQLILADQNHIPHDPPLISRKIEVRVK